MNDGQLDGKEKATVFGCGGVRERSKHWEKKKTDRQKEREKERKKEKKKKRQKEIKEESLAFNSFYGE